MGSVARSTLQSPTFSSICPLCLGRDVMHVSSKKRRSSVTETPSLTTIIKEEKCGVITIIGVSLGLATILSIAITAYVISEPLTCGDSPPPAPENGYMTYDQSSPIGVNSTASYRCAEGYSLKYVRGKGRTINSPLVKVCTG